jgi:hypothetical protein
MKMDNSKREELKKRLSISKEEKEMRKDYVTTINKKDLQLLNEKVDRYEKALLDIKNNCDIRIFKEIAETALMDECEWGLKRLLENPPPPNELVKEIMKEYTKKMEECKVDKLTIKDILAKYENFYKGGSGYTFQVEVDDFNVLLQYIEANERLLEWNDELQEELIEKDEKMEALEKEIIEHCETKGLASRQVFALTKRVDELVEERKGFKEFLQQTSDIDKRADALIKEQAEKIARFSNAADELQKELIEKDEKIEQLKGELVDKDKTIRAWRKR